MPHLIQCRWWLALNIVLPLQWKHNSFIRRCPLVVVQQPLTHYFSDRCFVRTEKKSSNKKGNKMKPFTFVGVDRTDPINVWSSFLKMAFSIAILLPIYFNLWDVLVVGANSVVLNVCLSRLNQKRPSCHFEAFHYCKKILNTTRIGDNNKNCCPCTDTAMEKSTFLYLIILYFPLKLIQTIIIIVYI